MNSPLITFAIFNGYYVPGFPDFTIGAIHTQVLKRPLVIEKEWINFD